MTNSSPRTNSRRRKVNPYSLYADCMEEIKKRTSVVDAFLTGQCHAIYVQTTAESVCLQIRKILELIALASLTANRAEYEKYRSNFHLDWNGKRILETLQIANPRFYPQPVRQVLNETTGKVVSVESIRSGYLTKKVFMRLYDKCGGILHADNPFGPKRDAESFLKSVPTWMGKIRRLLNHHQIQLIDDDQQLWVLMQTESDGKVHVFEFERVGTVTKEESNLAATS